MMSRVGPLGAGNTETRRAAASVLLSASRALARLARQVRLSPKQRVDRQPVFEFYAEAGAPEGALYIDGELVGHLPGVLRL